LKTRPWPAIGCAISLSLKETMAHAEEAHAREERNILHAFWFEDGKPGTLEESARCSRHS
jgi:hypothetical protein